MFQVTCQDKPDPEIEPEWFQQVCHPESARWESATSLTFFGSVLPFILGWDAFGVARWASEPSLCACVGDASFFLLGIRGRMRCWWKGYTIQFWRFKRLAPICFEFLGLTTQTRQMTPKQHHVSGAVQSAEIRGNCLTPCSPWHHKRRTRKPSVLEWPMLVTRLQGGCWGSSVGVLVCENLHPCTGHDVCFFRLIQ